MKVGGILDIWKFNTLSAFVDAAIQTPEILKQIVILNFNTTEKQRSLALRTFAINQRRTNDSLESWARGSDFAAILAGNNKDIYMRDMSNVFGNGGQGLNGIQPAFPGQYALRRKHIMNSSGLDASFQDPDPNQDQINHTFFYIQIAFYHGAGMAHIGNWLHEQPQAGASIEDWRASWEASFIGQDIAWGYLSPNIVGDKLRWRFSTPYGTNKP